MGRTFACSDLHGMYELYKKVCDFLQPDDIVYFLGDAIDRGPDSWGLFKEIINNPQWIMLKGNHEDMFANAIKEYYCNDERPGDAWYLSEYNGGGQTLADWMADGAYKDWVGVIDELPELKTYYNEIGGAILLSHAGLTPNAFGVLDITNRELIWDRSHFNDTWADGNDDIYIIHGHTPVPHIQKDLGIYKPYPINEVSALWYCDNHKCCIDLGSFVTRKTVLLDLNTFEEHYIQL